MNRGVGNALAVWALVWCAGGLPSARAGSSGPAGLSTARHFTPPAGEEELYRPVVREGAAAPAAATQAVIKRAAPPDTSAYVEGAKKFEAIIDLADDRAAAAPVAALYRGRACYWYEKALPRLGAMERVRAQKNLKNRPAPLWPGVGV